MDYSILEKYGKKISVLFVEDDEEVRKQLGFLLNDIFYKVDIAVNGLDGLQKYTEYYDKNKKYYDLIITDIDMPLMNGIELIHEIFYKYCKQKIIVLSAHNDSKYLMELINTDIYHYVLKTFSSEELLSLFCKVTKEIYEKENFINIEKNSIIKLSEDLFWNSTLKQIYYKNEIFKLTKKEFLLLELLLTCTDKVYTINEIIEYIWKDEPLKNPDISNLKNLISRLKRRLPSLNIDNFYGVGYKISF